LLADRAAAAPDLTRPIEADPALLVEVLVPFEERRQVLHALVDVHLILAGALRQVVADERTHLLAKCFLFRAVREVHVRLPAAPSRARSARRGRRARRGSGGRACRRDARGTPTCSRSRRASGRILRPPGRVPRRPTPSPSPRTTRPGRARD